MSHRTTLKCDDCNENPRLFVVLAVLRPEKAAGNPLPPYLVAGLRLGKANVGSPTHQTILTTTTSVTNGCKSDEEAAKKLGVTVEALITAVQIGCTGFAKFIKKPWLTSDNLRKFSNRGKWGGKNGLPLLTPDALTQEISDHVKAAEEVGEEPSEEDEEDIEDEEEEDKGEDEEGEEKKIKAANKRIHPGKSRMDDASKQRRIIRSGRRNSVRASSRGGRCVSGRGGNGEGDGDSGGSSFSMDERSLAHLSSTIGHSIVDQMKAIVPSPPGRGLTATNTDCETNVSKLAVENAMLRAQLEGAKERRGDQIQSHQAIVDLQNKMLVQTEQHKDEMNAAHLAAQCSNTRQQVLSHLMSHDGNVRNAEVLVSLASVSAPALTTAGGPGMPAITADTGMHARTHA